MRYLLIMLLQIGFFIAQAQDSQVDKLLKQGNALFAHELYEDAIKKYKQVIAFDKNNEQAHYELAYIYLTTRNWDDALYYCRLTLNFEGAYWLDAILIYGNVLDNKGNSRQAIREYKKALKKYPDESLLYYNLALSYDKKKEYKNAENAVVEGLKIDKTHLPSHKLLSLLMKKQNEVLKSMLPLYYCLLLEPDDSKKQELISDLQVRWYVAQVQRKKVNKPISKHSSFSGLNLAESKLNTISREASVNYPEEPFKLINQTITLLIMLEDVQTGELDFFDILYMDFFAMLHRAGHTESFSYFICSATYNPEVLLWVGDHQAAFGAFIDWMELQQ